MKASIKAGLSFLGSSILGGILMGKKTQSAFLNKLLGHAKLLGMMGMELELALALFQAVKGIMTADDMKKEGVEGWKEEMIMSTLGGFITVLGGASGAGSSLSRIGTRLNKLSTVGGYIASVGGIGMEAATIGIQAKNHTGKWYNYVMESGAITIGSYELGTAMVGHTGTYKKYTQSTGLDRFTDKMIEEPGKYSTNDFEKEYGNLLPSKNIRGYQTYNRATFGMLAGAGIKVVSSIEDVQYSITKSNSSSSTGNAATSASSLSGTGSNASSTTTPTATVTAAVGVTTASTNNNIASLLATSGIARSK